MHGISSSSISLLWNGSRTESFTPKRGLREGSLLLHVEILGLYHGLKLCLDTGFKHVVCHSDSTTVVELIQKDLNVHHKYGNLIMGIKQLLLRN